MSSYKSRPESIVNQIRNNLLDRYDSGYSILKELLQNADDAGAHRFRLDARAGWPNAENPLLRGPGLLIVNDGEFNQKDQEGILSFGESVKVTDDAAIGKFGFGQKAVFHLCDAFAVHAFGQEQPFRDVVNPFEDVKVEGNVTGAWKTLTESDAHLLREASADFQDQGLILWLPLRRKGLAPAPDAGFSSNQPTIEGTVRQVDKPDDLRSLLTTLRHLRDVEIQENGKTRRAVRVLHGDRLLGPKDWREGTRTFAGVIATIATGLGAQKESQRFVAREATVWNDCLRGLRSGDHWPRTHSALSSKPTPEKGEPHGAATLIRIAGPGSTLKIDWAVFLPVSEADRKSIPVNKPDLGCFRLLLHGYFFLDSGRRRIEGLGSPAVDDEPSDELRRAWNAELRDSAVLPLVPALLLDALEGKVVTSAELAAVTAAVAGNDWFQCQCHRRAICRNGALARVLERQSTIEWRIIPAETTIRPLPQSVTDHPERVQELFGDVHSWANQRGIALCVDPDAALTAEPMRWTPDELDSLFKGLSSRVFSSSRALAALLADFLNLATHQAIGPHVVRALRAALQGTAPLAPSEHIARILAHVPGIALFPLPTSVEHRQVLRAMADCNAAREMLPVRSVWVADSAQPSTISSQNVGAFLRALEPLIETPDADSTGEHDRAASQAAMSALALLRTGGGPAVAVDGGFADVRVLRGREPHTRKVLALSIRDLDERSKRGLLFGPSPSADRLLKLLVLAAPDAKPVIIDGKAAEYLNETAGQGGIHLSSVGKDALLAIVNCTSRFGEESARAKLIESLNPGVDDDRVALRKLCAGDPAAGEESAELRVMSEASNGIERIIKEVFGQASNRFLVPSHIANVLSGNLLLHIGIDELDEPRIETLLDDGLDAVSRLAPTETEREAFYLIEGLSNSLLQRLPIHARSDGTVGDADGIYIEIETEWSVPETLKQEIVIVQPCQSPKAQERQKKVIRHWSPATQVETALDAAKPHTLRKEILAALAALSAPSGKCAIVTRLRKTPWLAADDVPVRPADVLALPLRVGEQARALLTTDEGIPTFVLADALPGDIEQHPGFQYVQEHLLPGEDDSLAALARMIANAGLVGLVAPIDTEHADLVNNLATLAKSRADLALPGWPLLAAVLASLDPTRDTVRNVASSFRRLTHADHEPAGRHLDALAGLAADRADPERMAARQLYEHGFKEIVEWPADVRRKVFGDTRVPTADGGWHTGRKVVEEASGIAPTHVLEPNLARLLRKRRGDDTPDGSSDTTPTSSDESDGSSAPLRDAQNRDGLIDVDLAMLEAESAEEQRRFLEPWKDHVPPDLVIVYLALIGRYEPMRQVAREWRPEATADVDTLWEQLDKWMKPTRGGTGGPNPARAEIDSRRFLIREISGKLVPAISLSGNRFEGHMDNDASGLIVGNAHTQPQRIRSTEGGQRKSLIEIGLRRIESGSRSSTESCGLFRKLVETIATDCHHWFMSDVQVAFQEFLDRVCRPDQTTLEDTKRLLRDRLPTVLAEMKLPLTSACRKALQEYQREEVRIGRPLSPNDSPKNLDDLKVKLWNDIDNAEAAVELLFAARHRIKDLGYSADRILFELFQNADDAYTQLYEGPKAAASEMPAFRVEILRDGSGMRVAHWGRLINHLGANTDDGYRLGRDRDLLNMLVMNFSEKPAEGDLTGKFGLGFKSVHLLSDGVGFASGSIALRTQGAFLPGPWREGIDEAKKLKRDNRRATVIDMPFAPGKASEGAQSLHAFQTAAEWLPAFTQRVRRIEIVGADPGSVDCTASALPGVGAIDVILVSTPAREQRALRFNLGGGHSLLLAVDREGPCAFPSTLKRLWNLAPLEVDLRSGWLLNGPFSVDPGRTQLAGLVETHKKLFGALGQALGERFVELHELIDADWKSVAEALGLDISAQDARRRFWKRLFDVMSRDLDDDLARFLHARDSGYGHLAAEHPTTPTGLSEPFDRLVSASAVRRYTSGALADATVLKQVSNWPMLSDLHDQIVSERVAERLKKFGITAIRPITVADLLRCGMAQEVGAHADAAARFGKVVTLTALEEEPLHQERKAILAAVRRAKFLAQDDAWRPVKDLNFESGGEDERLICGFAPTSALLHDGYQGAALEFFKVARSTSGYGPRVDLLRTWADCADDQNRRRAVLRYVISGRQGRELAKDMHGRLPAWVPPLDDLQSDPLLAEWREDDKMRLRIELGGYSPRIPPSPEGEFDSKSEKTISVWLKFLGIDFDDHVDICDEKGKLVGNADFVFTTRSGDRVIWEHLGMWNNEDYRKDWEEKRKRYERSGFREEHNNLFTTKSVELVEILSTALKIREILAAIPVSQVSAGGCLEKIYDWWDENNTNERDAYAKRAYPAGFSPVSLRDGDRTSWFTMFALACFQSLGRTQDEQHRDFIDRGYKEGWWKEIAESIPPGEDIQPWLMCLERWSGAEQRAQKFLHWERTLIDLYTIARWLNEYIELFRKLPSIVRDQSIISLNDVLRPAYWHAVGPLGLEAAPLDRSLGIGVNWLIRELTRNGVYGSDDAKMMAPYGWTPTERVRK